MKNISVASKNMLLILSIVLVMVFSVNITLALFFSDSQISAINAIVVGGLDIGTDLLNDSAGALVFTTDMLLAGESYTSTLEITNLADPADGFEEVYIRIKAVFEMDYGSGYEENRDVQMIFEAVESANWLEGKNGDATTSFWQYYDGTILPGDTVVVDVNFVVYPTQADEGYGIDNADAGNPFRITVQIEAVQVIGKGHLLWTEGADIGDLNDYPDGVLVDAPDGWPVA